MDFLRILGRTAKFNASILANDSLRLSAHPAPELQVTPASRPSKKKSKKQKHAKSTAECSVFAPVVVEKSDNDSKPSFPSLSIATKLANQAQERIHSIRNQHRIRVKGSDVPAPIESWDDLSLPAYLDQNVVGQWQKPTPIQMQAIPVLTAGRELLAVSPTGSGKTAAFLIPILTQLATPQPGGFRAVVVSPTIELAQQTYRRLARMSAGSGLGVFLLTKDNRQAVCNISGRRDILVSTPKRLADAIREEALNVQIEFLIFDEGDCLWDDNGFIEEVDDIISACNHPKIVRALFSATMPEAIETLARTVLRDPIRVAIGNYDNGACETVRQRLVFAGTESGKLIALRNLFIEGIRTPILIFAQSKARVRQLHEKVREEFPKVDFIESEQTHSQREDVIRRFRAGEIYALITTEVLARGVDFVGVNCIINYDFPQTVASYIHRVGRTGRAGRTGEAITLFTNEDAVMLRSIACVLKRSGCDDVPKWMLSRRKPNRSRVKELKKCPPKRKKIGEQ